MVVQFPSIEQNGDHTAKHSAFEWKLVSNRFRMGHTFPIGLRYRVTYFSKLTCPKYSLLSAVKMLRSRKCQL